MFIENIIIGAGPAGLQCAYFFQEENIPYLILEKGPAAGTFFSQYPHSRRLISINKPNVGEGRSAEFALRHDWNSLLDVSGAKFTSYTKDYYPDRDVLVKYLNDFSEKNSLQIKYNVEVSEIYKNLRGNFVLETKNQQYTAKNLIVATGMGVPMIPKIEMNVKRAIRHYSEYPAGYFQNPENLETFRNKQIIFLGNGNSAFELANLLTPYASSITVAGRRPKTWAMSSHYTGDLRSIYMPYFDTFLLKSLNAIDAHGEIKWAVEQKTADAPYDIYHYCEKNCSVKHEYLLGVDHIILCTGWKFDSSIFNFPLNMSHGEKYPEIDSTFQSTNIERLFFLGSAMHSLDWKKSSGGFIHGFRYLIRYFIAMNYTEKFDILTLQGADEVVAQILKKINESSALYQMYGEMCDILHISDTLTYYNDVHKSFWRTRFTNKPGKILQITLEYGDQNTDIRKFGIRTTSTGNENKALLLHPVLRVFEIETTRLIDEIHLDEDLLADFQTDTFKYKDRLQRIVRMFL